MSQENVELAHKGFAAYAQGDYEGVLALLDPDIVYKPVQEAPVQGHDAVRACWERWEASWEHVEMTSEEVIVAGDHMIQAILFRGRGRGSGIEVEGRFFQVYTFRDGKTVRWEEFAERSEALEAAGLRD